MGCTIQDFRGTEKLSQYIRQLKPGCRVAIIHETITTIKGMVKNMKLYLAPMEGITGYIYRNAFTEFFGGIDRYFSPFISPATGKSLKSRELRDVNPENNEGIELIPQILTNDADGFLKTMDTLSEYGYKEFNLNLGCPSGTVVSKKKGSGFLSVPDKLDEFLYKVFEKTDKRVSVKTRLGMYEPAEFTELLKIYNKYPLTELIIHPRVQKDMYNNLPRLEVFAEAAAVSRAPVCYNGDIYTKEAYDNICSMFPACDRVMLGRGIIRNPALALQIKNNQEPDIKVLKKFHDRLIRDYLEIMSGERDVMFKMKELWFYMANSFENCEKQLKVIRKTTKFGEFMQAAESVFAECSIR